MPRPEVLDRRISEGSVDILRSLRLVRRRHGKSGLSQLTEMARLALGRGKIPPREYYAYRLYDDRRFTFAEKTQFMGDSARIALNLLCNDADWRAIADDKLLFAAVMQAHGFPVARTLALYHGFRSFGGAVVLRNPDQLGDFLRDGAAYPMFSKPVCGTYSRGVARIEGYDASLKELVLAGVGRVPIDRFLDEVRWFADRYDGYFFQELKHPHESVREICNDRIASLRLMILLHDSGPEIIRGAWKIPAGDNIADNFWREGNLLASLDVASGRVVRVVRGLGPDQAVLQRHPDSGRLIEGIPVPGWTAAERLCLEAAATLPGLRIQAWDVALCPEGPVLQEVNFGGSYVLPQAADGKGVLDASFCRFLGRRVPSWSWQVTRRVLPRSLAGRLGKALMPFRRMRRVKSVA